MAEQPRYEGTTHHCLQQKETSQGTKKDSSNYNNAKHSLRPASITNLTCSRKTKKNPTSSKLQQNHLKWPSNHNRCPSTLYSSVPICFLQFFWEFRASTGYIYLYQLAFTQTLKPNNISNERSGHRIYSRFLDWNIKTKQKNSNPQTNSISKNNKASIFFSRLTVLFQKPK